MVAPAMARRPVQATAKSPVPAPVRRPVAASRNVPIGGAGNAATARALSRSTTPTATAGTWAANAQDGQGNASVAALFGQPAPATQSGGGQPRKQSGFWDKARNMLGPAKSFMADKAWALLGRHAPELVPILRHGLGSWLQDRLANALHWLLGVLTAPVRAVTGVADSLNKQFGRLVGWMRTGVPKLVSTACKKISDGSEDVVKVVEGIEAAEDRGIAKLKGLTSSAGGFLGGLWEDLGAPVATVLGNAGSAAWQKIQQVAQWLWDRTQPIRDLGSTAWTWLRNTIGIGEGPEGRNGIIQWVQARAQGVWDWLRSKLATIPTPLKVAGGALLALSPAGPVLAAGAAAYGVVKGARWLWDNLSDPNTLVRLRHTLVDEVLPDLRAGVGAVKDALTSGVTWLTSTLTEIGTGLRDLAGALTAPILASLSDLVTWLRQRHDELVRWVEEHARPLVDLVARALNRLRWLAGQLLSVLKKVITVVGNPFGIGAIVTGAVWLSLPACMRSAILKFLLRLVQGALRLMPAPALGPLGAVLREAMIGFVDRALEEQSLVQLELMANRFSRLATRGSFDFSVGYGRGLLLGLWDGISGPFRMLWDIGKMIKNAMAWVRDLTLTALTERGRALVREMKSAWNEIANEIWPAVEAFLKGPMDPGKIIRLISGIIGEIAAAARGAGSDVFDQMTKYLKQSDRTLGESVGRITGSVIFEVALIVLTEGAYAAKTAVHKAANLFARAMTRVGELLRTLDGLLPKAKKVLDAAADIAGKKNRAAQRVTIACKRLLDKLLELLRLKDRDPDKKKPDHEAPDGGWEEDLDLRRVRATFKTDDGETHSLTFHGSGRSADLMVRSDPKKVKKLVSLKHDTEIDKDVYDASVKVRDLIDKIEVRINEHFRGKKKGKSKVRKMGFKQKIKRRKELNKLYDDLKEIVQSLGASLRVVMGIPRTKRVIWKRPTSHKFGRYMRARMLTRRHRIGSEPKRPSESKTWRDTLRRRAHGGGGPGFYYVQGHLLSESLGGPGNSRNLAPITDYVNTRDHEPEVEKPIKTMVHYEAKGVEYEVVAIYDRTPPSAAVMNNYRQRWQGRSPEEQVLLMAIFEAEAHIPSRLECTYQVVWDNGVYGKGVKKSHVVQNTIDQNPDNYRIRP
ncbi:hypothetical protein GCM10027436_12530 [Actinophytocola sediminis]